jgi:hypothetical protein
LVAGLINVIISKELSGRPCKKMLLGDGVTSPDLTIRALPGIFAGVSIDVRSARNAFPQVGEMASAAKNLDEYQSMICLLVPSLADSNPSKLEIQKYRLAIIAAFSRLVHDLNHDQKELAGWSMHARWLVEEASEAYLQAKSGIKMHPIRRKEVFEYFGIPSEAVDSALKAYYGQQ